MDNCKQWQFLIVPCCKQAQASRAYFELSRESDVLAAPCAQSGARLCAVALDLAHRLCRSSSFGKLRSAVLTFMTAKMACLYKAIAHATKPNQKSTTSTRP
eukprot:6188579-Pleurochrysis_carterae.AAC.5